VQAAQDVFNADEAGDVNSISKFLPDIIKSAKAVYTDVGTERKKSAVSRFLAGSTSSVDGFARLLQNATVKSLRPVMNELRLTKSEAELECMRKAGIVSGSIITETMQLSYDTEKDLWAELAYGYKKAGLDGEAYVPVVAGGQNALSIHYTSNDAMLDEEDVVLVDSGGQYGNYITDITRTWPIGRKFTDPQRDMYGMILEVQERCVELCREDADMTLDRLHQTAEDGLRSGLKDLAFDTSKPGCLDTLFPHHVGHYIGLEVHDAPGYPRTDRLKDNQCITIEPGIYVPPDDDRWPAHFRGLGIRIEDSIKVGKTEVEVLTHTADKSIEGIEQHRQQ
jgi:intermediate cleaving peptidase 55